ncbi:MAG: class I SAM-dependent methyltransferase [Kibdelosporangium sp.]
MNPTDFYDALADEYDLIFEDWWASAEWQGTILSRLLGPAPMSVLDCTCGIGTQALALATLGYDVTGSDVSEGAVARAREEASRRDIDVKLSVADVRAVSGGPFDAVISCDNSLPHLLTDEDLVQALGCIRDCLKPGGLFLASVRDYDALIRDQVPGMIPTIREADGRQRIVGQAWKWAEDYRTVEINLFVLRKTDADWLSTVVTTTYRALRRRELNDALTSAGFEAVQWPADTGYYQPIVTARRS